LSRLVGQEEMSLDAVHETVVRSWTPPATSRPEAVPSGPNPAAVPAQVGAAAAAPPTQPGTTPPGGQPSATPPAGHPGPTPPAGRQRHRAEDAGHTLFSRDSDRRWERCRPPRRGSHRRTGAVPLP